MKRFFLAVLFAVLAVQLNAQKIEEESNLVPSKESQHITRIGQTYYVGTTPYRGRQYAEFLLADGTPAFAQYISGRKCATAGWVLLGVGLGCDILGAASYIPVLSVVGAACEIACIPTLIVGYVRMHRSAETYNLYHKSGATPYLSFQPSRNGGVALALNF